MHRVLMETQRNNNKDEGKASGRSISFALETIRQKGASC